MLNIYKILEEGELNRTTVPITTTVPNSIVHITRKFFLKWICFTWFNRKRMKKIIFKNELTKRNFRYLSPQDITLTSVINVGKQSQSLLVNVNLMQDIYIFDWNKNLSREANLIVITYFYKIEDFVSWFDPLVNSLRKIYLQRKRVN